jgi:hypothetical protein
VLGKGSFGKVGKGGRTTNAFVSSPNASSAKISLSALID